LGIGQSRSGRRCKKIDKIVTENPKIINYQKPSTETLSETTVMNQQMKSFKAFNERKADVAT
jgi:hypothetical protein